MAKTLEERLKALQTEKDRRDKAVGVSFQRAMRAAARIKREDVVMLAEVPTVPWRSVHGACHA